MTEVEWLTWNDPRPMLDFLRGQASDRKLRLFGVACCRRVWHLLWDDYGRPTVEASERFADGLLSLTELERWGGHDILFGPLDLVSQFEAQTAASHLGWGEFDYSAAIDVCSTVARARGADGLEAILGSSDWPRTPNAEEQMAQCYLLCDIFGNPFRPSPPLTPAVLAWNDGTVRRLAQSVYEERRLPDGTLDPGRLAVLADALADAGCEDEELIRHCRSAGPHVRGCWALDLILGRQ